MELDGVVRGMPIVSWDLEKRAEAGLSAGFSVAENTEEEGSWGNTVLEGRC